MKIGDRIKIVRLGEARIEKFEPQRFGSTRYTTEWITIRPGDMLTFTGYRTPVGQSWGTVAFFELTDGREVRLPEKNIAGGLPPVLDNCYFEVIE